jgi:hypothetical protein
VALVIIAVFALFIGIGVWMERRDKRRLREIYEQHVESKEAAASDTLDAEAYDEAAHL